MHRFRKWSDPRRSQVPESARSGAGSSSQSQSQASSSSSSSQSMRQPPALAPEPLPALPVVSDFRTSLILPDLSRRFTLLRSSTGDPVSVDDLRSKFAEQRARGSDIQVSEEEEDMILDTLNRLRVKPSTSTTSTSHISHTSTTITDTDDRGGDSGYAPGRDSSVQSSPASGHSQSSKRYSNNLFGSGRLKDYSYYRSVTASQPRQRRGSARSGISTVSEGVSSDGTTSGGGGGVNRAVTPEGPGGNAHGELSSLEGPGISNRSAGVGSSMASLDESQEEEESGRPAKGMHRGDYLRRASRALEEAIREIEEDVEGEAEAEEEEHEQVEEEEDPDGDRDDQVLVPRSPVGGVNKHHDAFESLSHELDRTPKNIASAISAEYETGTALSYDHHHHIPTSNGNNASSNNTNNNVGGSHRASSPWSRSPTVSPTPRLPGYIPGMPRPMTPRDFGMDSDDQSTTPRATSPRLPDHRASPGISLSKLASNLHKRDSSSRTGSPLAATATGAHSQFITRSFKANGTSSTYSNVNTNAEQRDRSTPVEDRDRERFSGDADTDDSYLDFGTPQESSILGGRRRPASPLTGLAYQAMSVPSRPSTPSSITWRSSNAASPQKSTFAAGHNKNNSSLSSSSGDWQDHSGSGSRTPERRGSLSRQSHARNDSVTSTNDVHDPAGMSRSKSALSTSRSLRSPALPDSPLLDGQDTPNLFGMAMSPTGRIIPETMGSHSRSPSAMSMADLGPPASAVSVSSRVLRSPTPTGSSAWSPTSTTFPEGRMSPSNNNNLNTSTNTHHPRASSKQSFTSPFSLGQSHPLLLSPTGNSSRSSLESAGSSYHSWDEAHKHDRTIAMFAALESSTQPVWHDLSSGTDKSSSSTAGAGVGAGGEAEEVLQSVAGLTKADLVAVQERLIAAARAKAEAPMDVARERRESLKRRRPSTSQSTYSQNGNGNGRDSRAADPIPPSQSQSQSQVQSQSQSQPQSQHQHQAQVQSIPAPDHVQKALLESVLHSIDASPRGLVTPITVPTQSQPKPDAAEDTPVNSPTDTQLSSPTRRRRALADALFGGTELVSTTPSPVPRLAFDDDDDAKEPDSPHDDGGQPDAFIAHSPEPVTDDAVPQPSTSPAPPSPRIITPAPDQPFVTKSQLEQDVLRRTEAAMAQLKPTSSSNLRVNEISGGSHRRQKINPHQISSPTLVSASTSVDTIPLRATSVTSSANVAHSHPHPHSQPHATQNTSKLGSRFKRLRGTLRSKPGEETPYASDAGSPHSAGPQSHSQYPRFGSATLHPSAVQSAMSATEAGAFRVPLPSPPASAGPGLKGFMARFRRPRTAEGVNEPPGAAEHRKPPLSSSTSAPLAPTMQTLQAQSHHNRAFTEEVRSAPADNVTFHGFGSFSSTPSSPNAPSHSHSNSHSEPFFDREVSPQPASSASASPSASADQAALKQLFDAASNLGLDQGALNDLLARSGSISSKAKSNISKHASVAPSHKSGRTEVSWLERSRSPMTLSEGRPSLDQQLHNQQHPRPPTPSSPKPTSTSDAVRKLSIRKAIARPARETVGSANNVSSSIDADRAVLRRTLIFPSESRQSTADVGSLFPKSTTTSSRRRRSASAASVHSVRSIHDRAPTPPPPKSPTGRRFSTDTTPPMPSLPSALRAQVEQHNIPVPPLPTALEQSNSAYDSLYEFYATDGKPAIAVSGEPKADGEDPASNTDGRAVEVLELANGETIWSIVNGLRDDDAESLYMNRASFVSDYSYRDPGEGVQLFIKEHARKGSKDSTSSFLSRRKTQQQAPRRPETKVFFSSSQQIGRLIDNLSSGMEAGSFNIVPTAPAANSSSYHSESDVHWTVEERLEHMLGSMSTT